MRASAGWRFGTGPNSAAMERSTSVPTKLLFVVNHAGFFLSHRLPLALAARSAGYEVHVATPRSKHVPQIEATGLTWHEWAVARSGTSLLAECLSFRDLLRLYRRLRPDVVHHVTTKPVLYGTMAARLCGVPAVVNAVSGMGHAYGARSPRLLRSLLSAGYRFALRHRRMRVILQNREHLEMFVSSGWIRRDHAVLILGSGVDTDQFQPSRATQSGTVSVVFASRLLYSKGVVEFVEAARELRKHGCPAEFHLIGEPDSDNPLSVPLTVLQAWDSEGAVRYHGRREDMSTVFSETDIATLPTYYSEGVPKVLVEAAASGVPIVATDWPGCREIVEHGVNGLLVPIRDAPALAVALETLVRDGNLRRRMGEAGRAKVVVAFSLDAVITQTLDVYRALAPQTESTT